MVEAAERNIVLNDVAGRFAVIRAPSAKFVTKILKPAKRGGGGGQEATTGVSDSNIEAVSPIKHTHMIRGIGYDFRTVLVDPPRAGLDEPTLRHVRRYQHIMYVPFRFGCASWVWRDISSTYYLMWYPVLFRTSR